MGQYHEIWAFHSSDPGGQPAETIDHYALGAGAKLGEQAHTFDPRPWVPETRSHRGDPVPFRAASAYAAAVGLMVIGPWAGKRLIVIGDYSETTDVPDFVGPVPGMGLPDYYGEADDSRESVRATDPATADKLRNLTDFAVKLLGEAAGWSFTGTGWRSVEPPDDLVERCRKWHEMDAAVPHVIASTKGEYIDPARFGSSTAPLAMPFLGGAFPVLIAMLACSDGRGGGDLLFDPPGRWAWSAIAVVPRQSVVDQGYVDVSDWVLAQERTSTWVLGDE